MKSHSHVRLLATPWTTAYQTPPSMGFSRQEYWSGVPLPSPQNTSSDMIKEFKDEENVIHRDEVILPRAQWKKKWVQFPHLVALV